MARRNIKDSRIALSMGSVFACLTVMIMLIAAGAYGQQAASQEEIYEIELKDGSVVLGVILSEDDSRIHFRTLSQVDMRILKEMIVKKTKISGEIVKGELWRDDPNATRLLFSPTGRALKAGQGYFSVYEVFFPFVAVGITDFLAVAGGMTLIPGMESQAFYIAPKITPLQLKNFDFSLGALYARVPDEDEGAGIIFGSFLTAMCSCFPSGSVSLDQNWLRILV